MFDLIDILDARSKKELNLICKTAVISKSQFADFIMACKGGEFPITHNAVHRRLEPTHLVPTDDELANFGLAVGSANSGRLGDAAAKVVRKIQQTFDDRRLLSAHIFNETIKRWHIIYFDQRDTDRYSNHWFHGPHVHLINWLTYPGAPGPIIDDLYSEKPRLRGSIYVRFDENA